MFIFRLDQNESCLISHSFGPLPFFNYLPFKFQSTNHLTSVIIHLNLTFQKDDEANVVL